MSEITASEIVGEIRRAARLYEVFKRADDMLSALANVEQIKVKLDSQIKLNEKELERLDNRYAEVNAEILKKKESLEAEAEQVMNELKSAKNEAHEIMQRARVESRAMIDKAKTEVSEIKESIAKLKRDEEAQKILVRGLEQAREQMVSEMQSKRDQLLKAFS